MPNVLDPISAGSSSVLSPMPAPAPVLAPPPAAAPVGRRTFGDAVAIRRNIYDDVLTAARALPPLHNASHTMKLVDVDYEDPDDISISKQKNAILTGQTLSRRLRGTWQLSDTATGQPIDTRKVTIANVPHMTQRGTFILNGSEYTLANQMRLRPGVFTRVKENKEIDAHVNITPGKGASHHITLDPATSVFKFVLGQAQIPLMPLLKAFGATDAQIRRQWGNELYTANAKHDDARSLDKLYNKVLRNRVVEGADPVSKRAALAEEMGKWEMDPEVTKRTLGQPFTNVNLDSIMATTRRLVSVNKGEEDEDDRDHMAYQTTYGPEDLISERMKNSINVLRPMLWKATFKKNLSSMLPGFLTKHLTAAITGSGLGQPLEEVNLSDVFDQMTRVSRLGVGGIPSVDSIPDAARAVQISHFGYVDPIRTPESLKAGVDSRLSYITEKGRDGRLYTPFIDVRTGQTTHLAPQDIAEKTIAFPGEMDGDNRFVKAIVRGKIFYTPRGEVDLQLPDAENAFSPLANMIPFKNASKGQRIAMGSRMIAQALPLRGAEAPFVQSGVPGKPDRSFVEEYGRQMGAVHADNDGVIVGVSPDSIQIKTDQGVKDVQIYNNFPLNRKTFAHNTPVVQIGQHVRSGDLLAHSNYTDAKGTTALGLNLRTAYVPFKGLNFEDAAVISRSAAKRLTSEHMYQHETEWEDSIKKGKGAFQGLFAAKYDRKVMNTLDDDGVIKPGTEVSYQSPLILRAREKERAHNQISRAKDSSFKDDTLVWEHHAPGVVTDVVKTKKGVSVTVKSYHEMQVGDKLAGLYGDKSVIADIVDDEDMPQDVNGRPYEVLANPLGIITRGNPSQMIEAALGKIVEKTGRPYKVQDFKQKNLSEWALQELQNNGLDDVEKVFDPVSNRWIGSKDIFHAHSPYAQSRLGQKGLFTGNRYFLKLHHEAESKSQGRGTGSYTNEETPAKGGEGACFAARQLIQTIDGPMAIGKICEKKLAVSVLSFEPLSGDWVYRPVTDWFVRRSNISNMVTVDLADGRSLFVTNNHIVYRDNGQKTAVGELKAGEHLATWGSTVSAEQWDFLYGTMLGDASVSESAFSCEHSLSQVRYVNWKQTVLAGIGAITYDRKKRKTPNVIRGIRVNSKESRVVSIGRRDIHEQLSRDCYAQDGKKTVCEKWLNRVGGLGISLWVLDDGSITNRAKKAGQVRLSGNIATQGFLSHDREVLANWLSFKMQSTCTVGVNGSITLSADICGRLILEIANWVPWNVIPESKRFLRERVRQIQLTKPPAELIKPSRLSLIPIRIKDIRPYVPDKDVEDVNVYDITVEQTHNYCAASALVSNSKRFSLMDVTALLSHGATENQRDVSAIRGQKNLDWWASYMAGRTPPEPRIPHTVKKFYDILRGSGINPLRRGGTVQVMGLTNKDVGTLAEGRNIDNAETVNWKDGLKPIKGGLFDPTLTGGHGGDRWSAIKLHEPMPNPVMEDPIKRVLGLTQDKFESILSGREELNGVRGPGAIRHALESINLPKAIEQARLQVSGSKKTIRDQANRRLFYLKHTQRLGMHPKEWMLDRAPVLPPIYRPVSVMSGNKLPMVSDANYLYKELIEANENLREMDSSVDDLGEERLAVYNAFKGVTGLGDPITVKNQERQVKGLLNYVFSSSPKYGAVQRKLIGSTVDLVGRAVITPDPDLDMDQAGIPETKAWQIYKPFVIRRLARQGIPPLAAAQYIKNQDPMARTALAEEMKARPVILTRAPVLHRYGVMAFWPQLVKGETMKISPFVTKGFGADFDGDQMNYHVPASDEAVQEAIVKMMPSRNLLAVRNFKVHQLPANEFLGGLYEATTRSDDKRPEQVFRTGADAMRAFQEGRIDESTRIAILQP